MTTRIRMFILSILILAVVAPAVVGAKQPAQAEKYAHSDTRLQTRQEEFLKSVAPSIRQEPFGEFADVLSAAGVVKIRSSNPLIRKIRLIPVCTNSHALEFAEFFETLSRQTGTTLKYEAASDYWRFEPPSMPLPYTLSVAKGWRREERGLYDAYIPRIAPVGMDVYMMGRFRCLSERQLKDIRAEQALWFADKIEMGVTVAEMKAATVDNCDALFFESKAPIAGRQWRQWAFVKNGQAFVIVSTIDDKNEDALLPDVKAMVSTFHVVEPPAPFPGL
jgi:hypothetical protein